MDNNDDLEP
jgi:hypothetical protein